MQGQGRVTLGHLAPLQLALADPARDVFRWVRCRQAKVGRMT